MRNSSSWLQIQPEHPVQTESIQQHVETTSELGRSETCRLIPSLGNTPLPNHGYHYLVFVYVE